MLQGVEGAPSLAQDHEVSCLFRVLDLCATFPIAHEPKPFSNPRPHPQSTNLSLVILTVFFRLSNLCFRSRPLAVAVSLRQKRSLSGIYIETLSLKLNAQDTRALFGLHYLLFAVLAADTYQ
jgi:hypothetical protein